MRVVWVAMDYNYAEEEEHCGEYMAYIVLPEEE